MVQKEMTLNITAVGQFVADEVLAIVRRNCINPINLINTGMLGNFRTLTYEIEIPQNEMVDMRKKILNDITETRLLVGMYEHGDWSKAYVFLRSAFK